LIFDQVPEFEVCAMDYYWVKIWISNFSEQLFGLDLFHGVALSGADVLLFASLLQLESFFIIGIDNVLDNVLIYFMAFFFQVGDHVIKLDPPCGINL